MNNIPDFHSLSILVAGDLMLDRYWQGPCNRISPEAPVPVVRIDSSEDRPGGAGNVALNVAALGAQCSLLAMTGEDDSAKLLQELLQAGEVSPVCIESDSFRTITKLRILSQHQQLIRLDFEVEEAPPTPAFHQAFDRLVPDHDVVVLSDYGKGTLDTVQTQIQLANQLAKPVVVDPKGSDFDRYRGATVVTPNQHEFQMVAGVCQDETVLHERAGNMIESLGLQAMLITRGERGMSLVTKDGQALHIPTEAQEVFDVTGAGDTVVAMLACAIAAGCDMGDATRLANAAAGVTVGKLGAATVTVPELKRRWHSQRIGHGVVTESELIQQIAESRRQGETIVMTNGCFDILHAGHVHYLNQAAAMGDRLIIAVNVDETVRDLKGEDRPVNNLESRMAVLAGLSAVDWVVPFSEATPERLICQIQPDYLVKGGDNNPDEVPGADCVREHGGKVAALDYIEGKSTTHIIGKIKQH